MTQIANEQRGETMVSVGGQDRVFRLTAQAMREFKTLHSISVLKATQSFGEEPDEELLFSLLYVGCHASDKALTREQFDETATLEDLGQFARTLTARITAAFGDPKNG